MEQRQGLRLVVSRGEVVRNSERLSLISPSGPLISCPKMSRLLDDLAALRQLKPAAVDAVALLVREQLRRAIAEESALRGDLQSTLR